MSTNILILCDTSIYHAVIVSTQDQKDAYLQNGFTLYGGPVDANGLPTNSNWCREQLGLPTPSGPSGCQPNDLVCESTQGRVMTPTGCYLAEQTPLDQCFDKNTVQSVNSQPNELPRTGSNIDFVWPLVCVGIFLITRSILRKVFKIGGKHGIGR